MKHLAPTIVIEVGHANQPTTPEGFSSPTEGWTQFTTLQPSAEPSGIHPLGTAQPAYLRNAVMLNRDRSELKRNELLDFHQVPWEEIPEYFQDVVAQEVGRDDWSRYQIKVRVRGELPTERIDRDDAEGEQS